MDDTGNTRIRIFGLLRAHCVERGLPTAVTFDVPAEGMSAEDLAHALELPLEMIEGVFVNHTVYDLNRRVMPGDEVAFVPYGTPGPHRVYLGLYKAGKALREPVAESAPED